MAVAFGGERERIQIAVAKPPIKGAGIIIVDPTGENILVVEEHKPKTATNRRIGEVSIPLETAKQGLLGFGRERRDHTILGAFTEIANDTTLPHLQSNLREVELSGAQSVRLSPDISAHLAVFVHDGELTEGMWSPTAEQETAAPRWMRVTEFLQSNNIREFAHTAVTFAIEQGYLQPNYLENTRRRSVLQQISSIEEFSRRREQRPDVVLV